MTMMSRFFLVFILIFDWKKRPTSGRSPRTGTLSSMVCTSSRIRPPRTTVKPSLTKTLVVTRRTLKTGWRIWFVTSVLGASSSPGETVIGSP